MKEKTNKLDTVALWSLTQVCVFDLANRPKTLGYGKISVAVPLTMEES